LYAGRPEKWGNSPQAAISFSSKTGEQGNLIYTNIGRSIPILQQSLYKPVVNWDERYAFHKISGKK
jgi:hypothetical protein